MAKAAGSAKNALDVEITAIRRITQVLSGLTATQRVRVWQFVATRLTDESMPSITPTAAPRAGDADGLPTREMFPGAAPADGEEEFEPTTV